MKNLREKVEAKLIKNGNSPKSVKEMMDKNYDYAVRKYTTLKTICECLVTLQQGKKYRS